MHGLSKSQCLSSSANEQALNFFPLNSYQREWVSEPSPVHEEVASESMTRRRPRKVSLQLVGLPVMMACIFKHYLLMDVFKFTIAMHSHWSLVLIGSNGSLIPWLWITLTQPYSAVVRAAMRTSIRLLDEVVATAGILQYRCCRWLHDDSTDN